MKKTLALIALLMPISTFALGLINNFEWLEPNNRIEIVVGEPYQLKFNCSDNSLPFTSDYADSWVHYDFDGGQHVVDTPTGYSIDNKGIITGLVAGSYAIKFTGWIQAKSGTDKWLYITVVSDDENMTDVAVTGGTSNLSYSSVTLTCYANIPNDGETFIIGVRYSTDEVLTEEKTFTTKKIVTNYNRGNYSFTFDLKDLDNSSVYYYQAFVQLYSDQTYYYGDVLSFSPKAIRLTTGEAINMGVSVMWASTNLGAEQPENDGDYYAYGELEVKDLYTVENYKYFDKSTGVFLKLDDNISGNKFFDVAAAILGDNWRMPTYKEYMELRNNSITTNVIYKGRKGVLIESTVNGNTLFMPYNGVKNGGRTDDYDNIGGYWAASYGCFPGVNGDFNHWEISFYGFGYPFLLNNSNGLGIRPVKFEVEQMMDKCATPTIAFKDGKLVFDCETEGVTYVYSFKSTSSNMGDGNNVSLPSTYTVTVYAKKDGYENSDTVTEEIDVRGLMGDMNEDGSLSVTDVTILIDKILKQK